MNWRLTFLFSVFALSAYSQDTSKVSAKHEVITKKSPEHKFSIGGSFGYGFPAELYGSQRYYGSDLTPTIGFADPGIHFDGNLNYQISQHFGLLMEIDWNDNPIDKKAVDGWFGP